MIHPELVFSMLLPTFLPHASDKNTQLNPWGNNRCSECPTVSDLKVMLQETFRM